MNKFASTVSGLAALGSLISGLLVFLHYYPDLSQTYLCGGTFLGNCNAVSESHYATPFGQPLAIYGLFFYLVLWSTMLVADCAQGSYVMVSFVLLFPLVVSAVLVDLALSILLFKLRLFCFLCVLTYAINLTLLVVFLLWLKWLIQEESFSFRDAKVTLQSQWQSPERKVASSFYLLFLALLGYALFSTSSVLELKATSSKLSQAEINEAVQRFYALPVELLSLPPSNLTMGPSDSPIRIIAFTDFLCPACRRLFDLDHKLSSKYGNKLSVIYYNYPLDSTCNPYIKETIHPFACVAARAVIASADLKIFAPYLNRLITAEDSNSQFSPETALKIATGLSDSLAFQNQMEGSLTNSQLRRDIDLAEKLNITSTPTLFINGRRVEGVPPEQVIEAIIDLELANRRIK